MANITKTMGLQRLSVLFVWTLAAVSVTNIIAAPTNITMSSDRLRRDPYWYNPCGCSTLPAETEDFPDATESPNLTNLSKALQSAVNAASRAHLTANTFKEEYAQSTSQKSFDLRSQDLTSTLTWLPSRSEIPKSLGDKPTEEHLKSLELKNIQDIYRALQKIAVGVEKIVVDKSSSHSQFSHNFQQVEGDLRNVLCEIQGVLNECHLKPHPNVTRDIMPSSERTESNQTYLDVYHFLIFREYINGLEYIIDVFTHMQTMIG